MIREPATLHVLVDRDGVLNHEAKGGYVLSPDALVWEENALPGLRLLHERGAVVSVITNQSCIGRGLLSMDGLRAIHDRLTREALAAGGRIDGIYACPHAPNDGCRCRKPKAGLLIDAMAAAQIPADLTVFIGDTLTDLQAAKAAGVRFVLVRTGKGAETERALPSGEVPCFDDLLAAAQAITTPKG